MASFFVVNAVVLMIMMLLHGTESGGCGKWRAKSRVWMPL
jgi:preprotein translocase subunit SecG